MDIASIGITFYLGRVYGIAESAILNHPLGMTFEPYGGI
jgi:hypothetical protein